jgi:hypothetical protein
MYASSTSIQIETCPPRPHTRSPLFSTPWSPNRSNMTKASGRPGMPNVTNSSKRRSNARPDNWATSSFHWRKKQPHNPRMTRTLRKRSPRGQLVAGSPISLARRGFRPRSIGENSPGSAVDPAIGERRGTCVNGSRNENSASEVFGYGNFGCLSAFRAFFFSSLLRPTRRCCLSGNLLTLFLWDLFAPCWPAR